jgi:hypothetical protein
MVGWRMGSLEWLNKNGAVLPGGTSVRTGKEIWLRGTDYEALPASFTVYRRFGVMLRYYRRYKGKPEVRRVGQPLTVHATDSKTAYAGPWVLPTPGRRLKWRLFFVDGTRRQSEELHDSRLGRFTPAVGVSEGVSLVVEADFIAAIDPEVQFSVITPWGTGEDDFQQYVYELAADLTDEGEEFPQVLESVSAYFDPQYAPEGWSFEVQQSEFELAEGERARVRVRVDAPTTGGVTFALQMKATIDDEAVAVVSEPMVAYKEEGGTQASLVFGGDDEDGGALEDEPTSAEDVAEGSENWLDAAERMLSRRPSPAR